MLRSPKGRDPKAHWRVEKPAVNQLYLSGEHYLGCYRDRTAADNGSVPDDDHAIVVACPLIIAPYQRARIGAIRARNAPRVTLPRITNSPVLLTGLATCGHSGCGAGLSIRTGKGGRYAYYTCNTRLTAGAASCSSKPIRQEELDSVATKAVLKRVLAPDRLKELLAHILDRPDAADHQRRLALDRTRHEQQAPIVKLRRLYKTVEDGLVSHRDPIFADRLASRNEMSSRLVSLSQSLKPIGIRQATHR